MIIIFNKKTLEVTGWGRWEGHEHEICKENENYISLQSSDGITFYVEIEKNKTERFIDNGDGTITDTKTGLMWEKSGSGDQINWHDAIQHAKELRLGGYADWRLPTIVEIKSVVNNFCNEGDFSRNYYWTSTTYTSGIGDAVSSSSNLNYLFRLVFSLDDVHYSNKSMDQYYVRCCRTIGELK